MEAMKSNPRNNPSMPSDGSREEGSSVLFSLEALVAKAEGAPAPAQSPAKNVKDESGLIDLKAIEAAAQNAEAAPAMAPLLPVFPFGSPEPAPAPVVNTPEVSEEEEEEPINGKSKKGRWIAASLVAAAISAVAIGVASAGSNVEPLTLNTGFSPAFGEVAKRTSKAIPAPEPVVVATNEKDTSKDAAATQKSGVRAKSGPVNPRPADPKPADVKVETPKPPPPPADNCDLMCQMRRAASKK